MRGRPTIAGPLLPALLLAAAPGCGGEDAAPAPGAPEYTRLSDTGLYADLAAGTLAPGVCGVEPTFALWSDGADKERWIALPEGATVDTGDMNRWSLPVGTRVWKQFSLDGTRLETRFDRCGRRTEALVGETRCYLKSRAGFLRNVEEGPRC